MTSWTIAHQAPLLMGFPRQEFWNRFLFPSPGDLPDTQMEPKSHALQVDSLLLSHHSDCDDSTQRVITTWSLLEAAPSLVGALHELGFPGGSDSKESACSAGHPGSTPGSGRSPEKEMAAHSSILAWRIPWTEEPGGLQSMGPQRVRHN